MQIKQQIFDGNKNPQKISFVSMVLSNLYESNFQFKFFFSFHLQWRQTQWRQIHTEHICYDNVWAVSNLINVLKDNDSNRIYGNDIVDFVLHVMHHSKCLMSLLFYGFEWEQFFFFVRVARVTAQ